MTSKDVASSMYDQLKVAQRRLGKTQVGLAREIGVPQPRISEFETRMRDGEVTKQMELLILTAEKLGLVPMLVPEGALEQVTAAIQDYEIVERIGSKSVFDAIYDEVEEEQLSSAGMSF